MMKKNLFLICSTLLFTFAVMATCVLAQDPLPKVINGGVINGKAVKLPSPEYPAMARSAHLSGAVGVNVTIDESGLVISAEAELYDQRQIKSADGIMAEPVLIDPSLREAAESAARLAIFSPVFLNGQPVKIKGKIIYNFVADEGEKGPSPAGSIDGGILNGKALKLPAPEYPAAAMAVKAEGTVAVQVTIDEGGNVIAAKTVSGHPLLRAAAEAAAVEAKFSPAVGDGKKTLVSGIITYNFVLQKKVDQ